MRACAAFSDRLASLSRQAAWASTLLAARVDTRIALQNRDLLSSMNRRTRLQLRLQQTVEGLSIVAITYYLLGIAAYVAKGAHALSPRLSVDAIVAACVPLALLLVWRLLRRLRVRIEG
jgi:uncharacterized membrane-anchored protein